MGEKSGTFEKDAEIKEQIIENIKRTQESHVTIIEKSLPIIRIRIE